MNLYALDMDANASLLNLSVTQLRRAAELKERIDALNDELRGLLGGEIPVPFGKGTRRSGGHTETGRGGRRKMSAAGRARIAAAAKARWAKVKAQGGSTLSASGNQTSNRRKKRTMSPAARAKIAAAAKARWAKVKAAKGA